MTEPITSSKVARFFGQGGAIHQCSVSRVSLEFIGDSQRQITSFRDISDVTLSNGVLWRELTISLCAGEPVRMRGLRLKDSSQLLSSITTALESYRHALSFDRVALTSLTTELEAFLAGREYAAAEEAQQLADAAEEFREQASIDDSEFRDAIAEHTGCKLSILARFLEDMPSSVLSANNDFLGRSTPDRSAFFKDVESSPLTDEQRIAALTDDTRTRVLASAGSGKSSVIVAKAGHLLATRVCAPEEILCLSFSSAAVKELRERVVERLGACESVGKDAANRIHVKTFHKLGLDALGIISGIKPNISKLATDASSMQAFVHDIVESLATNSHFAALLVTTLYPPQRIGTALDFKTQEEYELHLRNAEFRGLNGDLFKSYQEVEIANFLSTHGVKFEYEQRYPYHQATAFHAQYTPDFYLPKHNIYLEHFGIDRSGHTAPGIDEVQYNQDIWWKRELHKKHSTTLIETFSYDHQEGKLISRLRTLLEKNGISIEEKSALSALATLREFGTKLDPLAKNLQCALGHLRSQGMSVDDYKERICDALEPSLHKPTLAFASILEEVSIRYQDKLDQAGEVDFSDMIRKAAQLIRESDSYAPGYKRILVDEFQDISKARADFISALIATSPGARLFVVGDDWQAIYRFAGGDLSLMTEFDEHFGASTKVELTQTFRFDQSLCDVSRCFIESNPAQLRKKVFGRDAPLDTNALRIHVGDEESSCREILADIAANTEQASVVVLGRYGRQPNYLSSIQSAFPALDISYSTVHKSKGITRDYTIVVGMTDSQAGFPNKRGDTDAISVLLSAQDQFPFAEERRLFYVAITRSRFNTYVLVDKTPSIFVSELLASDWPMTVTGNSLDRIVPLPCPKCETGTLIAPIKQQSAYKCNIAPICSWSGEQCRKCRSHYLLEQDDGLFVCQSKACAGVEFPCPGCVSGKGSIAKAKSGKSFLACNQRCNGLRQLCPVCTSSPMYSERGGIACARCDHFQSLCPVQGCGGLLTPRKSKKGTFLGCTKYRQTGCKGR